MKALITGANGFVGAHLARRLAARKDDVRCLVRRDRSNVLGIAGLEIVEGDVVDPASLRPALEGIDVVFHLAGIRRSPDREEFMRVNAEGTRHVCEAMIATGARRLVLVGSLAASGPSVPDKPLRESDPLRPTEWYGESKAEAERIAFSYAGRLEVTVIRPSRILGPGDRENLPFFKIVRRGLRLDLLGPRRPISFVDVDDVVDLCLLLAERPEAVGEAFFCSAAELSLQEMEDLLVGWTGVRARNVPIPPAVLKGLAAAADVASKLSGRHLPLNRKLARQLLAPAWTCSTEKAERVLGWRAKVPIEQSLRESLDWYQAHGWL
ncbi:MAG: NAD-dependent epimerase/dehydratase family protein [Myxococcaceae bacterium]|nr:NAD-dependent epimerase/dehydratase family protein [Myxococcaceae bacterium]